MGIDSKLKCEITTSVISKAKNFVKKQRIKEIKISKNSDQQILLEQYEANIKKLSDYADNPDNEQYNDLYMDYRAVVALLSPLKSFRNIPKYCSLYLLAKILELGNDKHSEGYTTDKLPTKKGEFLNRPSEIQQTINKFREETKKDYKDDATVKQIRKHLKNISQNLPALYAKLMNEAKEMQQQNTKDAKAKDAKAKEMQQQNKKGAVSEDFKNACTAISKAHLYNKNVREAIYMEDLKNIKLYEELEKNINTLKNDAALTNVKTQIEAISFLNFINISNNSDYEETVTELINSMSSVLDIKTKNNLNLKMLKNSFAALKANLEQDLKYIKKHHDYIENIKSREEEAKNFEKNCKDDKFEEAKKDLKNIISILKKSQSKYINDLDSVINM